MNDAAYDAKIWLMRNDENEQERLKTIRTVLLIQSKLNNSVASYEQRGRRDRISAQASHEDLLADYSEACKKLEAITSKVLHEDIVTIRTIDKLQSCLHQTILLDVHLNRQSFNDISKSGKYDLKKRQLYNHYKTALQELAAVLAKEPR